MVMNSMTFTGDTKSKKGKELTKAELHFDDLDHFFTFFQTHYVHDRDQYKRVRRIYKVAEKGLKEYFKKHKVS